MTTQKKPVVRTSNSNVTGVVVKPNNHSFDCHGSYTFSVRVVQPNLRGKSYVGIVSAFATSQDEAKRNIENDLKEGYFEDDSFVLLRFQPIGQDVFKNHLGLTSVHEFLEMFSDRSNRPVIAGRPYKSRVYDFSVREFVQCSTAA
jgi:hypothetical protein